MIKRNPELQVGINFVVAAVQNDWDMDPQINRTVREAQNYIEYLEQQEDRLHQLEDLLNTLAEKNDPTTNEFLKAFDALIIEG